MIEPSQITYPVRLDDLITAIKNVHDDRSTNSPTPCWLPRPSARSPTI